MRHIGVRGDAATKHDIVVKPTGAQQLGGFPQKVEIYDYSDTFAEPAPDPYGYNHPCIIDSPHHVTCAASGPPTVPGDKYSYLSYAEVGVGTGNLDDSVQISDPLNPMFASVSTGAGNDRVAISGMWQFSGGKYGTGDSLGEGDDVAHYGPAPLWDAPLSGFGGGNPVGLIFGRLIAGGPGADSIDTLNGSMDHVSCGDGSDTWQSDVHDDQQTYAYAGPPDTNGDCESRTPPVAVDPSTLP
jgi:hypothetical protein